MICSLQECKMCCETKVCVLFCCNDEFIMVHLFINIHLNVGKLDIKRFEASVNEIKWTCICWDYVVINTHTLTTTLTYALRLMKWRETLWDITCTCSTCKPTTNLHITPIEGGGAISGSRWSQRQWRKQRLYPLMIWKERTSTLQ